MSQGISAGFGLASMLLMVNPVLGGTAVAIGAVVAGGIALLTFLDSGNEKTKQYADTLKDFGESLRGASTSELKTFAEGMRQLYTEAQNAVAQQKQVIKDLDKAAEESAAGRLKRANTIDAEQTKLKQLEEAAKAAYDAYAAADATASKAMLNNAEVRKITREAEISAIRDQYQRQRAEASTAFNDEKEKIILSTATEEEKRKALIAIRAKYNTKIAEINQAEKDAAEQKEKEITAAKKSEADKRQRIAEEESRFVQQMGDLDLQQVLNRVRQRGLEAGKTETQIAQDIHDRKVMAAQAELQIILDMEARGEQIDNEILLRKKQYETDLTALAVEGAEMRKAASEQERQVALQAMQTLTANLSNAASNLFQIKQQSVQKTVNAEKLAAQKTLDTEKEKQLAAAKTAEEREKIEKDYAAKKEALDAEMEEKAKGQMRSAFQLQKAAQIANAMVATYSAAAAALAPPPLGLGPVFGPIVAATAIAAGLTNVGVIASQQVPGLARGAKVTKPGFFQVGEAGTEWVMPEKNFIQAFRDDLSPRLVDIMAPTINGSILAQINASNLGGSAGVTVIMQVENYYGNEEHFEKVIKPGVEEAMRRAGIRNANALFLNTKDQ